MCGICGYIGCNRPELLEPMCSSMAHRGPDDFGTWYDVESGIGLGHRRLSIIDLSSAGHQPMLSSDGTTAISYNGETYNFQEYREALCEKGYEFRGHSDTEVVLCLYEEYGIDFLNMLNGIFALAIWDSKRKKLVLARDHAGVKPLYYWQDGDRLYFASEIKALLRVPDIPRQINEEAVPLYLTFLWVPGEQTMLKSVRKIEPGHYLVWQDGRVECRQWFSLDYTADDSVPEAEWIDRVRETFLRTTRRQMVSDAPLGAFLSGGLDSSSIVACMRRSFPTREINCYTMEYKKEEVRYEGTTNDYPYAKQVAESLGVNLKSRLVTEDILDLLPKIIYHLDEPDADPAAILTNIISEMAHKDGIKVLLSGTGADEVFFGYRSHQAYRLYSRMRWFLPGLASLLLRGIASAATTFSGAHSALARRASKLSRGFSRRGLAMHLELIDWSSPQSRRSILSERFSSAVSDVEPVPACMQKYFDNFQGKGDINCHSHMLIQTFLAAHNFLYCDKATMAASVETRVPFMDVELMRVAARIPERYKIKGSFRKPMLKKAMADFLPTEVLQRDKTGFGAPLRMWLTRGLDETVQELLSPRRLKARGLFRPTEVQRIIRENRQKRVDHTYLIYELMSLEIWMQTFIDRPGLEIRL